MGPAAVLSVRVQVDGITKAASDLGKFDSSLRKAERSSAQAAGTMESLGRKTSGIAPDMDKAGRAAESATRSVKGLDSATKSAARSTDLWQDSQGRWRTANGRFATDADKAAAGVRSYDSAAQSSARSSRRMGDAMASAAARAAKLALAAGAVAAAWGLKSTVQAAATFEKQMSDLGAVTNANAKQMAAFRKQAIKAGADTAYSAREAAQAQTELAKGGVSVANIMKGGLKGALSLAAAGEMNLADAASTTANALNLFGLKGSQAGHVADVLATAANKTTADVSDFAIALTQGGAAAKAAGLNIDQTVAYLESLAASGVKGSDAGTSMKTALIQLASPTAKAAELMNKLGLEFFDSQGNMKSVQQMAGMLRDKMGGLTREQRLAAASTLVGTDGMRGLLALYDAGPKKMQAYVSGLQAQGTAEDVAAKKQDNLAGKWEQFTGSLETLEIQIGSLLIPALSAAAVKATEFLNAIGNSSFLQNLGQNASTAGAQLRQAFGGALAYVNQVVAENRQALDSIGQSLGRVWSQVKTTLAQIGAAFKQTFGAGTGTGRDIRNIISAVMDVGKVVADVLGGAAVRWLKGFAQQWQGAAQVIRGVIRIISGLLTLDFARAWQGVKDIVGGVIRGVIGSVRSMTAPIREVFSRIGGPLVSGLKAAWSALKGVAAAAFQGVVNGIKSKIQAVSSAAANVATTVWNAIKSLPGEFLQIGKHIVQGLIDGIKSKASDLAKTGLDVAKWVTDPVSGFLGINSPSKLFRQYGVWLGVGLALGLKASTPTAVAAAAAMGKQVGDAVGHAINKSVGEGMLFPLEAKLRKLQAQGEKLQAKLSAATAARSNTGGGSSVYKMARSASGDLAVVSGGRYLQNMGLQVGESKYFGGVTTSRHKHYPNDHYSGNSIDVNYAGGGAAELSKLQEALAKLKAKFGSLVNAFIEDAGTANQHLHATFQNARVAQSRTRAAARGVSGMMSGGSGGRYNRVYAAHPTGTSGAALSPSEVMALAMRAGFSKDQARQVVRIAKGESSFMPGIFNSKDGGTGLLQMTPSAWPAGSAAQKKLAQMGGIDQMRNPMKNLEMAKWLYDQAGWQPWDKTRYGNSGMYGSLQPAKLNGMSGAGGVSDSYTKSIQAAIRLNEQQQKAIEKAIAFRDAIRQVKDTIQGKLSAAVDAFRAKWEKTTGATFDYFTAQMVANSPAARALAELQAQDQAIQQAQEDAQNAQALADAQASGDQGQIAAAQAAIDQTARNRQIAALEQQAAIESQQIEAARADERDKLKAQEVQNFKKGEKDKLDALVASLKDQEISYKQFVMRVKSLLAEIGISYNPYTDYTPDQEAAISAGKGRGGNGAAGAAAAGGAAIGTMVVNVTSTDHPKKVAKAAVDEAAWQLGHAAGVAV